jgi:small-conductance mechanosensitive channel
MRANAKKVFWFIFSIGMLLFLSQSQAQEQSPGDNTPNTKQESLTEVPDLADIIPLASRLSGRLESLENNIIGLPGVPEFEKEYDVIEANLTLHEGELQRLKGSEDYRVNTLVLLREEIRRENESFEDISIPLKEIIDQLDSWRKEWLGEGERWNELRSAMLKEEAFAQLGSTFTKANDAIDQAQTLIVQKMKVMLILQEKVGHLQTKIYTLVADLDGMIAARRHSALIDTSSSLLSSRYFSQFEKDLWVETKKGIGAILWVDSHFFTRNGWILLSQGLLFLLMIIAIYRNRQGLSESARWHYLASRPFSAALFLSTMGTMIVYEYSGGASSGWSLFFVIVAGFSFTRLVNSLIEPAERRQFVYGLLTVLIMTRLFEWISLPRPLFRLFTVCAALFGLFFCSRWTKQSRRREAASLYTWVFRLVSLFLAIVVILELSGKQGVASYLFMSSIRSVTLVVAFLLFRYMIRGALEWLFRSSMLHRAAVLYKESDSVIRRAGLFVDFFLWGLFLFPAVLMIWNVYETLGEATKGLLGFEVKLGAQRISVGLVLVSAGILYVAFFASWILQKVLTDQILARRQVEMGVREAMAKLVHYVIVFVGFLLALSALGLDFTKLTIIMSALGVGIGFGLQGVANNFISGIILLFERPVRVGDTVEAGGQWARIKRIGLRSTTVTTLDESELIIPNANLVNNEVTNWTLSNRRARIVIPVGVAYGSDVPLVIETLIACAKENSHVAKTPDPQVLFLSFGESSLDFELRIWVSNIDERLRIRSEIHQEIDRRFREADIEIAFPQRDLHVRTLPGEIMPTASTNNSESSRQDGEPVSQESS